MSDPCTSALIGVFPVGVFLLLLILGTRPTCSECGGRLPLLISPLAKTRRQWLEGGQDCPNCGTDVDARGRKVEHPGGGADAW